MLFSAGAFVLLFALAMASALFRFGLLLPSAIFLIFAIYFKKIRITIAIFFVLFGGTFAGLLAKSESEKNFTPENGCEMLRVASNPTGREFLAQNGKLRVILKSQEPVGYGDIINACSLKKLELDRKNKYFLLSRYQTAAEYFVGRIELVKPGKGFIREIYDFKKSVENKLNIYFTSNNSALANGLIFGGSGLFSKDFMQYLKNSGTSHIVAVSGYNISIIIVVLFLFFRTALSKYGAVTLTISTIVVFVVLTGLSASVIRAAIMGMSYLISRLIGRSTNALYNLVLACGLMIIFNPYTIFDASFQLSALATFGIIIFAEKIEHYFEKVKFPKIISETLSATLAAQFMTIPVLIGFGKISLIAPISNVLILPIVPFAMLFVFLTIIASLTSFYLGFLFASFTNVFLSYILFVIKFFGRSYFALSISQTAIVLLIWAILFLLLIKIFYVKRQKI